MYIFKTSNECKNTNTNKAVYTYTFDIKLIFIPFDLKRTKIVWLKIILVGIEPLFSIFWFNYEPISPRGRTSVFYTHSTQTSTMFVKKSIQMHSIAFQLLKKKVHVAFFRFELYTQRNINIKISMRNDFDFWKNTCQVKYDVFKDFFIFSAHIYILLC